MLAAVVGCSPTRAPCTPASSTSSRTTGSGSCSGPPPSPYAHLVGADRARARRRNRLVGRRAQGAGVHPRERLADPRNKYVPELEEEKFQSLLSVPIVGATGTSSASSRSTRRRRASSREAEVDFLTSSASLVAGAIENARLYEETRRAGRRARAPDRARRDARPRAETLDELLPRSPRGSSSSGAQPATSTCSTPDRRSCELRASAPPNAERGDASSSEPRSRARAQRRAAPVAVPLVADDELLGLLVGEGRPRSTSRGLPPTRPRSPSRRSS